MSALLTLKGSILKDCSKEFSKVKINNIIPICEYILFDKGLATVTNLEESIDYKLPEETNESFLIPIKQFKKISKRVKVGDDIVFGIDENDKIYLVINGKQKFIFDSLPVEDFPIRPIDSLKNKGEKLEKFLCFTPNDIDVIKKANKFSSNDKTRPALQGVCLFKNKIVSTNGNILFWEYNDELKYNEGKYIIPSSFVKLLNKEVNTVKKIGKFNLVFEDESTIKTCRLIDENYPNVDSVGNFESINSIELNTSELKEAIEDIKIQEGKDLNIQIINKGEIRIFNSEKSYEQYIHAECQVDKNEVISFDIKPLEFVIKEIDTETITFSFKDWKHSVVKVNDNFIVMSKLE